MKANAKKIGRRIICAASAILFAVCMSSCAATVTIQAKKDCSSDISVEADIGNAVYDTIKSVTAGISESGTGSGDAQSPLTQNKPIFSATEIKKALSQGDIANVSVTTPSKTSLSVNGTLAAPADQNATLDGKGVKIANIVTCKTTSLTVILSPETIREIIASLPESTKSYLDLLMAPVFTGETMSASEYEDLVAAVYGDDLKKELASSSVKITLVTPTGVTLKKSSIGDGKNVKTSADRAVFTIPLTEFLTLQSAQTFSITW